MKPPRLRARAFVEESRPVRGAWIETPLALVDEMGGLVAPRAGRVD